VIHAVMKPRRQESGGEQAKQGSNFILFRRHKLGSGQDLGSTLVFYIFADRNRRSNHMEQRNGSDSLVVHPKLSPLYPSPGKLVQRQANVNSLLRIRMIRGMLEGRVPWSGVIGVGSAETPRCLAARAIREPHEIRYLSLAACRTAMGSRLLGVGRSDFSRRAFPAARSGRREGAA